MVTAMPSAFTAHVSPVVEMTENATIELLLAEREEWKKESPSTEH
jgi:hypothetical protein